MIKLNMTFGQQADFTMPMSGSGLVACARALWTGASQGGVRLAAADSKRRFVDATPVCGYRHITDVAVLEGAFPGTSAWSPPI